MKYSIEKATNIFKDEMYTILKYWNMHHIPSPEMEELDLNYYFIAKVNSKVVGLSGYEILSDQEGETTLLAIHPDFLGTGIGKALQKIRLEAMYQKGIKKVITNSDRKDVILWYKKNFGYKETGGKIKKLIPFGKLDVDSWTTLEMDLTQYIQNRDNKEKFKRDFIQQNDPPPLSHYEPLIINVALTGVIPTKTLTKYVPISVDEIIEDAIRVYDAGASIVHIHARDKNGIMTSDARYYEDIIKGIKKECPDLICCATTSGRDSQTVEQRKEVLYLSGDAKPDMASLTLGSLNFLSGTSVNSIDTITELAYTMKEQNIKPELEIFDAGMVNLAKYLERHGVIEGTKYFNILLGNINTAAATIKDLSHIYTSLPQKSVWATAGLGDFQLPMNIASIIAGGNVRVGLEDNIYLDVPKTKLAKLVQRVKKIAQEIGRDIATPLETKKILEL